MVAVVRRGLAMQRLEVDEDAVKEPHHRGPKDEVEAGVVGMKSTSSELVGARC
jgi:hypothetical protein